MFKRKLAANLYKLLLLIIIIIINIYIHVQCYLSKFVIDSSYIYRNIYLHSYIYIYIYSRKLSLSYQVSSFKLETFGEKQS